MKMTFLGGMFLVEKTDDDFFSAKLSLNLVQAPKSC